MYWQQNISLQYKKNKNKNKNATLHRVNGSKAPPFSGKDGRTKGKYPLPYTLGANSTHKMNISKLLDNIISSEILIISIFMISLPFFFLVQICLQIVNEILFLFLFLFLGKYKASLQIHHVHMDHNIIHTPNMTFTW